jgi:hypothetical protein
MARANPLDGDAWKLPSRMSGNRREYRAHDKRQR